MKKNEIATVETPVEILNESEVGFVDSCLKSLESKFDVMTTVKSIVSSISLPDVPDVKVEASDVMEFMKLSSSMHLDPIMGGIYGFKDKKNRLVLGVSLKGWRQALSSQPTFAGVTYKRSGMVEKKINDGRGIKTLSVYESVTCVITKILPNGAVGEFEGTAYFDEEFDPVKTPWLKNPKRMLENRALTIAASNAYGWGAYDPDSAEQSITRSLLTDEAKSKSQQKRLATVLGAQKNELLSQMKGAHNRDELVSIFKAAPSDLQKDAEVISTSREIASTFTEEL